MARALLNAKYGSYLLSESFFPSTITNSPVQTSTFTTLYASNLNVSQTSILSSITADLIDGQFLFGVDVNASGSLVASNAYISSINGSVYPMTATGLAFPVPDDVGNYYFSTTSATVPVLSKVTSNSIVLATLQVPDLDDKYNWLVSTAPSASTLTFEMANPLTNPTVGISWHVSQF